MKTIAIVQSSYIPWRGYFDIINSVDEFILYDDVQFTKRDWRSRNIIKTSQGSQWLTIPIQVKGKFSQKINEAKVSDLHWAEKHWQTITHNYIKASYFDEYQTIFEQAYREASKEEYLSKINYLFIKLICNIFSIKTKITWTTDYDSWGNKTDRLISLCKSANATHYLSGPSASTYIQLESFKKENIELSFINYDNYQEYPQLYKGYMENVTILDLIFNTGINANKYLKSFK